MIYGYVRVSTKEQCLDRQIAALKDYAKIDKLFQDKQSGKDFAREQYIAMKDTVCEGDTIVVKELDRLGRNKDEMKKELEWFKSRGVTVRILELPTTLIDYQGQDWIGDMVNNILIEVLGAIAEQERKKTRQRQAEGIAAKKARGEWDDYGRPRTVINKFDNYKHLVDTGKMTVISACRELGVCRATWYKIAKERMVYESCSSERAFTKQC